MKFLGFTVIRHAAASVSRHAMAKSFGDLALAGAGVSMAAGSVVFAGYMLMQNDHGPHVNGMEYLAIFAKPSGGAHPVVASAPPMPAPAPVASAAAPASPAAVAAAPASPAARPRVAGDGLDMAPTGSIAHGAVGSPAPESYRIVAVEPGIAWLSNGSEIRAIKPGDSAPGLGRVAAIEKRGGRWTLVGDSGAALLTNDSPERTGAPNGGDPFARRMIFGSDN